MIWLAVILVLILASDSFALSFYSRGRKRALENPDAWLEEARKVEEWQNLSDRQLLRKASTGYYLTWGVFICSLVFLALMIVDLLFGSIEIFTY